MIWRTGLAPWEFEFFVPGSLMSTVLEEATHNTLEPDLILFCRLSLEMVRANG
jgi:hypothetical protein